ncbi:hypothetical protein [Streptantibioticus ferralitis]|uniref:hypothetical protein n=1 Tax=Streptantibioticus ferralitis TaxID=236510 RepID=UPI0027E22C24|nr:hypothetical protein [Streptantibioticus ferralitis]
MTWSRVAVRAKWNEGVAQQRFLHRGVQVDPPGPQVPPLRGVFGEGLDRADGGHPRGLVTADDQAVAVEGDLFQTQRFALDLPGGDRADHVVARVHAAPLSQVHEVQDEFVARFEGVEFVRTGQRSLAPPEQLGPVRFGDGQQIADRVHRHVFRDLGGEVEGFQADGALDERGGALLDLPGDRLEHLWRQGAPHEGPQFPVARPVRDCQHPAPGGVVAA